ncbi:hypothetical protein G5C66_08070 [Nocardioides sp. KC13]|uniref:WD40 repeat domain-containing protein n=1 Tax=Nocardioides turkmenicus TaxID=2711220 RepID=A0A6M1R1Y0_9ACTN|nr:hypothetical protein [Nocardioides sp. KC13]NGN92691.1 hypothetical protein [Nocardioides sp. KC13]
MRGNRIPALATAILAALMLPVAFLSPASAAPSVSVRPLPLPLGAPPTVPYIAGSVGDYDVIDGDTKVSIPMTATGHANLLGASGNGYLVRVFPEHRIVRVEPGKAPRLLVDLGLSEDARLSSDGRYLLLLTYPDNNAVARVLDAATGKQIARRTFRVRSRVIPLDVRGTKVLIGAHAPARTLTWNWSTGAITTIANRTAYVASYATDRLATYDTFSGQPECTYVSKISTPTRTIWRTCAEKVVSFSPDGARIATAQNNGGAEHVMRRSLNGTLLTRYTNMNGVWVGRWETNSRILLQSYPNDRTTSWLVRCEASACERAAKGHFEDLT